MRYEKLWKNIYNEVKYNISKRNVIELNEKTNPHNPEVVGSSPASATRKEKVIPTGWLFSFLFSQGAGLEPIYMELSGGQFLPPVQTLVATTIFDRDEEVYRVLPPQPKKS